MSQWTYQIYSTLKALSRAITSEEAADTDQEMVRQPVRDTRDTKRVPVHRDRALRAARCPYTEDFRREDLQTAIPK